MNKVFHYTSLSALKNMLTAPDHEKEVCFWVFGNRYKNDDQEITIGAQMYDDIKKAIAWDIFFIERSRAFNDSYSFSFSYDCDSEEMWARYCIAPDAVCLVFREQLFAGDIYPCTYIKEQQILPVKQLLINKISALKEHIESSYPSPPDALIKSIELGMILNMIPYLWKAEEKWAVENECRLCLDAQENEQIFTHNDRPYLKRYYPNNEIIEMWVKDENTERELSALLQGHGFNIVPIRSRFYK